MLRNYFRVAIRKMMRNKGFTAISICGLSVGLAVVMLIGIWIYDEVMFNQYHLNYDRVGQVMVHNGPGTFKSHPIPLADELKSFYKDQFDAVVISTQPQGYTFLWQDKILRDIGVFMQPEGAEIFSLRMLMGQHSDLAAPNSIFLSKTLAQKIFGDSAPLDQVLKVDNKMDLRVAGVFEDFPRNSDLYGTMFVAPWDAYVSYNESAKDGLADWSNNFIFIYTKIAPNTDFGKISSLIKHAKISHISKEKAEANKPELFIHPMSKWHFYSKFENRANVTSDQLQFVRFYTIIGIFVVILACINFTNLSTVRSEKQSKEIGVRKMMGSQRRQLIGNFYSESVLVAVMAFLFAVVVVYLTMPSFNELAGKETEFPWNSLPFWAGGLMFSILVGLLAGSYPALYLSSFKPVVVLRGKFRSSSREALPRKALVVLQFTISIALIIGTIAVYRQVEFAKGRAMGYDQNKLVMVRAKVKDVAEKYLVLVEELKATGVVSAVGASSSTITSIGGMSSGFDWKGKDPEMETSLAVLSVTPEYGETIGWKIKSGRNFDVNLANDSASLIINEAAARYMGLLNPVGETVRWETDDYKGGQFQIIGLVDDMVMASPFEPATPTVFFLNGNKSWLYVRIDQTSTAAEALPKIETVMKKMNPLSPFEYRLVDEQYALKIQSEVRIGKVTSFFAVVAILISCLGLFGLASFMAEQRAKEISIRKIIGASEAALWRLLSRDFLVLVGIACIIATPVAYYVISGWLEKYPYRTELSWWIFALACGSALVIGLSTISYQIIKATFRNPTESLRLE